MCPTDRVCYPCSDSDEEEGTKKDNTALLRCHLKYEADVLFTRCAGLGSWDSGRVPGKDPGVQRLSR